MFLYLQLFVAGRMRYLRYLCVFLYSGVQHVLCCGFCFFVILKFVSDLRQEGGFLRALRFSPQKKWPPRLAEIFLKVMLNTIPLTHYHGQAHLLLVVGYDVIGYNSIWLCWGLSVVYQRLVLKIIHFAQARELLCPARDVPINVLIY
jgi:hypothetical protein